MTFLRKNKYHVGAFLLITVMFIFSVIARKENLKAPLANPLEWITAHTLITCDIWQNNGGPSAYHFSPVYTYPGKGNQRITMLGGVVDTKGEVYYVSYPPFSFLFAYYATQLSGGTDAQSIRILSLSIHFVCAILIYILAIQLQYETKKNHFSIAGITASFLYLFSSGNLWVHGNLYFADILLQPLFIAGILFAIRLVKGSTDNENKIIIALGVLCFFASYTEWLGVFFSFISGLIFLLLFFLKKEKKFIQAFLVIGFSSALAVAITVAQYSAITGFEKLKKVSTQKYDERSGRTETDNPENLFTLDNSYAHEFMIDRIDYNYKMAENFIGIFTCVFLILVLIPNARRRIGSVPIHSALLALVTIPIAMHYLVFFNFNAMHDFASVKAGFLFVIICLIFVSQIEHMLSFSLNIVFFCVIAILAADKGMESIHRYHAKFSASNVDWNRIETGAEMRKNGKKDAAIFMNITANPELVYVAGHNVFPIKDTSELTHRANFLETEEVQYYHHNETKLDYILEFKRVNQKLILQKKIEL